MKALVILLFTFLLLLTSGTDIRSSQSVGVRIEEKWGTLFSGQVGLDNACVVVDDQGKSHEIQGAKAVCALEVASRKGSLSLTLEDMTLGLFLKQISNRGGDWVYWVNKTFAPVGLDSYELKSGDSLVLSNISQDFPEEKLVPSPLPVNSLVASPAPVRVLEKNTLQPQNPQVKTESPKSPETPKTTPKDTPIGAPLIAKKEEPKPSPNPSASSNPTPSPSPTNTAQKDTYIGSPSKQSEASPSPSPSNPSALPSLTSSLSSTPPPESKNPHDPKEGSSNSVSQTKNLPKTGPEFLLLGIGGSSLVAGSILRLLSNSRNPLARLLK